MIELADLKAHVGTAAANADPDVDTVLVSFEARAVDFVERTTGRHFGPSETRTEILEGVPTSRLWLRENPSAITSVEYRQAAGEAWVELEEAADAGFELRTAPGSAVGAHLVRKGGQTWEPSYEWRVVYDFGYSTGGEPEEIRGLVIDLVLMRWRQRGLEGQASGRVGDFGFTLSDVAGIPGAREILRRWRPPVVG